MALRMRGAVTAALFIVARQRRNPSFLSSVPKLRFHCSPSYPLHSFKSYPCYQTGYSKYQIRAIHEASIDPITPKKEKENEEEEPQNWKIKMLYDGDCSICMNEVKKLREKNKSYGAIKFVDISSDEYSPEENQGLDYETVMGTIHAILSDGTVLTDVEAFKRLYEEVGLEYLFGITKYKPMETIAGAVYGFFSKYRLKITGRPPLEEILEARKKNKGEVCTTNTCKK